MFGVIAVAVAVPAAAQDLAPSAAEASEPAARVGYDGGFYIEQGDFALEIGGRVQPRFELVSADIGDDRDTDAAFEIARARLTLSGHAFHEELGYKFQADFGKGEASLKDFYVDAGLAPALLVRVGQFKRPFSREQITSSSRLSLVDRSITDKAFGNGRDIGVALHNGFEKSPELEWVVGVFNGASVDPRVEGGVAVDPATGEGSIVDGEVTNAAGSMRPALVARVGVNTGGIKGYRQADFEGGPLRAAVALAGIAVFDADGGDDASLRGGVDTMIQVHGLTATGGVWLGAAQDGDALADLAYDQLGGFAQVAYLVAGRFEPALRYALVSPEGPGSIHEILGGVSVYLHGHSVKWQTDAGALVSETTGVTIATLQARTQLQFAF